MSAATRLAAAAAGACGGAAAAFIGMRQTRAPPQDVGTDDPLPPPSAVAERRFCRYGLPSEERLFTREGYASSVSYRLRIPTWVAEHYSREDADGEGVDRKHSRFVPDDQVPEPFRSTNGDYRGSNLSRGHMAPAGAHKQSQAALDETFLLSSNILPQELSNNGSDWLRLERWSRGLLKDYSDVYVISGPLFLPTDEPAGAAAPAASEAPTSFKPRRRTITYDVIGEHEVAVPTHLFKVVLAERPVAEGDGDKVERRLSAFVLPNGPLRGHPDLDSFAVPLVSVEKASGLELFPKLGTARHETPPLCGGGVKCGVGAMDGRIIGWKRLAHLKLAGDCEALKEAWGDVPPKAEAMGLMSKTYESMSASLACPLLPKPAPDGEAPPSHAAPPATSATV